jgi:hypothetical protein
MALNEGAIMSEDEVNAFIHPFKPDIRQSTLQLQYILSSGKIDDRVMYFNIFFMLYKSIRPFAHFFQPSHSSWSIT